MRDLKYEYQLRAEEIAQEEYGMEYEELCTHEQLEVYDRAMEEVHDKYIAQVDAMRDALEEV